MKRVLVYRLGSLGDTVVALPSLHLVANVFPQAERRMLTSYPPHVKAAPSSAILENTGLIHGYFRYSYGTRSLRELFTLWLSLVRWRPEVLVYMSGPRGIRAAKRDAMFFRLCGITNQIGVPDTAELQSYARNAGEGFHSPYKEGLPLEYECSRLARNLAPLGDAHLDDAASWDLHLTKTELARSEDVLLPLKGMPFIAASVGTKRQPNDWGPENWNALAMEIGRNHPGHALVLCGAGEEMEASENVAAGWKTTSKNPVINLCGLLSPRESAGVFGAAVLFIGHDSGPMHLAAAMQTPCVAVFSARNLPRVWFPYGKRHKVIYHNVDCQNCGLELCIAEKKKCIMSITVGEVAHAVANELTDARSEW